jgi:hypothetical protein
VTLIITTVGPAAATMVGDRRLTANGRLVDDDAGKQGYWLCSDAAVLYAYSGIARAGSFDLQKWIPDTFYNVAEDGDFAFVPMISRLAAQTSEKFASHRLIKNAPDRRTTITFAGFMGNGDPVAAIVSNYEGSEDYQRDKAGDTFTWTTWRGTDRTPDASATFLTGNLMGLKFSRWSELNDLLLEGRPPKALRGKSIDLLTEAAESSSSAGTVGKRMLASTLLAPSERQPPEPSSLYISDVATPTIHALDMVTTLPGSRSVIWGVTMGMTDGSIARFPTQPRNAMCKCGSGLKYKRCHGRRDT